MTTATGEDVGIIRPADGQTSAFIRLCGIGAAIAILTLLTPIAFKAWGDNAYIVLTIPAGILALLSTNVAERAPIARTIWLIVGLALALRLFVLLLDPLLSTDIYRYVWDGRVQAAGINPYRFVPEDPALASLRDAAIYPHINRAWYATTVYPPVAQTFFLIVTRLGESVTVMRLALLGCEAVTVAMIFVLLRRMDRPVTRIVAYLWHPLPLWEIANSGHIDALMVALMMAGLTLALSGRPMRAAIAITLGALAKPIAILALPAIWRPWDWRMPCVVVAVVVICYVPYLSVGAGVLGFLTTGYLNEESLSSGDTIWPVAIWRLAFGATRGDIAAYLFVAAIVLGALALIAAHRDPRSPQSVLGDVTRLLLAFLLLLSPNYPWYFLAIMPFVVLHGGATVWAASIGALLLQDEVVWDYYVPWLVRKTVLYGGVLAAFSYSIWSDRRGSTGANEPWPQR
jgi:alpha-1,6-mannosyltransferase